MDLTLVQIDMILANFARKCPECEVYMQPTSTRCGRCGQRFEFVKVVANSYYEHFEIMECKVCCEHTFHFCSHPFEGCKIKDLEQWCIKCITKDMIKAGGAEIIKTDKLDTHIVGTF